MGLNVLSDFLVLNSNITSILVFITVFLSLYLMTRKPKGIPPGPVFTLPILGDLPLLFSKDTRQVFKDLRQKHGNIFSFYLGKELTIVINGYDLIHKALVNKANVFSERPKNLLNNILEENTGKGIIMSNGPRWKEQRRFTHAHLKKLGFGKTTFENQILKEVKYFVDVLLTQNETPFDLKKNIHASVFDVLCSILIGKRFSYDDEFYQVLLQNMDEINERAMVVSGALSCFPFLRYSPVDLFQVKIYIQNVREMRMFLRETYEEHVKTRDNRNIQDFMDVYDNEIRKRAAHVDKSSSFDVEQMLPLFIDLFVAGSETTATAIRWAIVYILNFPEIKERLQSDIDKVVLTGSLPSLKDKCKLPYIEAFILETLRFANIVPLAVPHATIEDRDLIFDGFRIPKGTTVMFNLDSVLFDPNIFENPTEFNPNCFLDEHGGVIQQKELIPFGIGRRKCIGESMAKMEMFLYLTTLLKTFDFLPPDGEPPPDVNGGILGVSYSPCAFEVRAVRR